MVEKYPEDFHIIFCDLWKEDYPRTRNVAVHERIRQARVRDVVGKQLKQLREIRAGTYSYVDGYGVSLRPMTEQVVSQMLDLFCYLKTRKKKKPHSVKLKIFEDYQDTDTLQNVVSKIYELDLFDEFSVEYNGKRRTSRILRMLKGTTSITCETAVVIRDAILALPQIKIIELDFLEISKEAGAILSNGLKAANVAGIVVWNCNWETNDANGTVVSLDAVTHFQEVLAQNTTLETLRIIRGNLPENRLAQIVRSLKNHPSLKTLSFCSCCTGNDECLRALSDLLSSSDCRLRTLEVNDSKLNDGESLNLRLLTEGLSANSSLKNISLSRNNICGDISDEFTVFLQHPKLEYIDLLCNNISSFNFLPNGVTTGLSKHNRFQQTAFLGNPVWTDELSEEDTDCVLKFLTINKQVIGFGTRYGGNHFPAGWSRAIHDMLDSNVCGRVLFEDPNSIGLSVWPRVFERANTRFDDDRRQANVIFQLVHGFMGL